MNQANVAYVTELVARARGGDRLAFDRLVELHAPAIYSLALRITHSREDAEDCVQEAFVRAYAGLRSFRGDAAFSTWLYRVGLNVAREAAKKRGRLPLSESELAGEGSEAPPALERVAREAPFAPAPDEAVAVAEKRRVVLQAIRALPSHHREVIVLGDLQGLSYEEMAAVLKVRVGTVKSRLNRARLALKDALTQYRELLRE